jgi:hypothetical protein
MFSYNYKVVPVNEANNIYKLTPTKGALLKAFLPTLVLGAVGAGLWVAGQIIENNASYKYSEDEDPDTTDV